MKKRLLLLMMAVLSIAAGAWAANVTINATNFPDENFRNWILSQTYGADGILTDAEIAGVTKIDVSQKKISDLKGVEFFTALTTLFCDRNKLTTLDISKNTALERLNCCNNQLTVLDVSKNTALILMDCHGNQLKTLDVSKNTTLKGMDCANNQLTTLDVSKNKELYQLWFDRNSIRGEAMNTLINSLYDRSALASGELRVYQDETATGNEMTAEQVDAVTAKNWQALMFDGNDWVDYPGAGVGIAIDATNFPDENFRNLILAQSYGADGFLSDTEIAGILMIDVSQKNISDLKGIEFFTALQMLYCYGNQLTTLDISKNTALELLNCCRNQLTTLDVSKNTALDILDCSSNKLTTLDVSKNTALTYLECSRNQLTALNVSKNTALLYLYCYENRLTSLDVSKNTALTSLYCYGNKIRGAGMATLVNGLYDRSATSSGEWRVYWNETATGNEMTAEQVAAATGKNWKALMYNGNKWVDYPGVAPGPAVDATNFPDTKFRNWIKAQTYGKDGYLSDDEIAAVKEINVASTGISNLKGIELFAALENLYCYDNQLTALDVSKNTALKYLYCADNKLTALDVSKNTALEVLSVNNNQLTALNVSKNKKLYQLYCSGNGIMGDAMQTLVNSLYDRSSTSFGYLYVYDNTIAEGNEMTAEQVAAAMGKNWKALMYNGNKWVDYPGVITGTVTLNKTKAVVRKKKTVTLKATLSPETLTDKSVTWESSDESIATVSNDGVVTGVKSGVVTITCTSVATGAKATCTVTVGTITLNKSEIAVNKGKTVTLTPTVYPTTLTDQSVTWKSSKTTVATVSSTGEVKGVKSGTATITCTSNATGLSTTCKVTVGYVKLDKSKVIVKKNNTVTLTPTVYPSSLDDKSVKWKSSDKTIATVSSTGKVKGVKSGIVTITCTSVATGLSTTCQVTVGTITLDKKEAIVRKKNTLTLTPTVYPTTLEDKSVKWKSSDKSVATVSSDGVVTGVKSGVVTITCTSNATGLSATCTVTVGTITLDKSTAAVGKGKTITLTPTVYPTSLEDKSVTWKSSKTSVATVTSTGKVKGVKAGTATITCTSVATGLSTTCQVTVGTAIDATNFPDEKFRSYVSSNCDPNKDGVLTSDEIAAVKEITVSNKGITDLKGVEHFTALYYLSCYYNKLKTLDVSKLTGLEYLYCYNNQLTALDVSNNTALKNLKCYKNQLTTLDVSKNKKLTQLHCYGNNIRGDGMKALISSLYDRSSTSAGKLYVYNQETSTGNKMTKSQVSSVKAKNWQVLMNNGTDWVDYPGGTPASASARTIDGDEEDAELTDIEIVEETPAAEEPFDVFDLRGHKVRQRVTSLDGLPAGVYIVKGKKVMKK